MPSSYDLDNAEHDKAIPAKRTIEAPRDMQVESNIAGDPVYIGLAAPGSATSAAVWQIRKFTYDGSANLASVKYADGVDSFTKAWDGRATYTY